MIPDPRDTMAELTKALDGEGDSYVKRFAALVLSFPQDYAHALCRIAAGLDDASSIADIAKACRIHRSTAQRHIDKAKRMLKHIQDLQNAADEVRNRADSLLDGGEGRLGTHSEGVEVGEGGGTPLVGSSNRTKEGRAARGGGAERAANAAQAAGGAETAGI